MPKKKGHKKYPYTSEARSALERVRKYLKKEDDNSLRHAALELRFCIECIVYEKAKAYEKELPKEVYENWQPRRLMQELLQVDSSVYHEHTAILAPAGTPKDIEKMKKEGVLVTEHSLAEAVTKNTYNSLGSLLHIPSIVDIEKDRPNFKKQRKKCEELVEIIQKNLDSKLRNFILRKPQQHECEQCKNIIVKDLLPYNQNAVTVYCDLPCPASFDVSTPDMGETYEWKPRVAQGNCRKCETANVWWRTRDDTGAKWSCKSCGAKHFTAVGVHMAE